MPITIADIPELNQESEPYPAWLTELRDHQWTALEEIQEGFARGIGMIWVDGPTGTGKTAIGECVRRMLRKPAAYVCSGLTLQDQFARDFEYAKVLKGKSNYPTLMAQSGDMPNTTADACMRTGGGPCMLCPGDSKESIRCPYRVAKFEAVGARLAVLNTTYLLYEANTANPSFSGQDLIIADECDELEGELLGYTEYRLSKRMAEQLKTTIPKSGSHYVTIAKWLRSDVIPMLAMEIQGMAGMARNIDNIKRRNRLIRLEDASIKTAAELDLGGWVRDDNYDGLVLKPISVARFGQPYLWSHAENWLNMSATIISSEQMSRDIGAGDWSQLTVSVPMTFPVENRIINFAPIADMSRTGEEEGGWEVCLTGICNLLNMHPGERIVIHAVSYRLTKFITEGIAAEIAKGTVKRRKIISYTSSAMREAAIARYRRTEGAVIVAPSLDRGVDFKGDDCRVQIIAKVPYPYLGDKQIKARMNLEDGQQWYTVRTIRDLVQMTGRGVRSETDYCTTYILDRGFGRLFDMNKRLIPAWWREAVNQRFNSRPLKAKLEVQ